MGMRINTNTASIGAQRNLSKTTRDLDTNLRKLSSGERITRASDDAAGLAISEKLKAEIRSIRQAKRNAEDGISLIQTAEGGMQELSSIIIRLRELSMQAATDTLGDSERAFADVEYQQLKEEVERIAQSTEFNGTKLLDGTSGMLDFQIGIRNNPFNDRISYDGSDTNLTLDSLGLSGEGISSKEGAQGSLQRLDDALVRISGHRAELGALQNRLTSVVNNHEVSDENLSAANSRIRDVDIASETASMAKNQILNQAGASVLAQANQSGSLALKLIG